MDIKDNKIIYSPTDLIKFIESPYVSWLEHFCLENPTYFNKKVSSKLRNELFSLGNLLEAQYYKKIENYHFKKIMNSEKSARETIFAANTGYKFIAQAHLKKDSFEGYADLLVREKGKSKLGNYYYTVKDIKRASVPKAKFIIQICCYLEMLEKIQGVLPEKAGIILGPYNEEEFIVKDYYDYYLNIKELFLDFHNNFNPKNKPTPSLTESLGDWEQEAIEYLEKKDSLQLLSSIDKEDLKKLESSNIKTRGDLLTADGCENLSPERFDLYKKEVIAQKNKKDYILLEHNEDDPKGLLSLPKPTEEDIIIDIRKSDSYHKEELFYSFSIFNLKTNELIQDFCFKKDYERGYISKFLKVLKNCKGNIYFFGNRVLETVKESAASQGVFLESLEKIIFDRRLIDLQLITQQSIAIPYYDYTIESVAKVLKDFDFEDSFGLLFNFYYHANKDEKEKFKEVLLKQQTEYFNIILLLKNFLNSLQTKHNLSKVSKELREDYIENNEEVTFEYNFNLEKYNRSEEKEKIELLLKQFINFYKNEKRPKELETINLLNQEERKLEKNTRALSFLVYKENPIEDKPYIRKYKFYQNQEYKLSVNDRVLVHQLPYVGATIKEINTEDFTIILQFSKKQYEEISKFKKISIIENNQIPSKNLEKRILKTALSINKEQEYLGLNKALYNFLAKDFPDITNIRKGSPLYEPNKDLIEQAQDICSNMNNTCLIFQGPPGAGKTYTTAKIVYKLLLEGKKIAISSNSHKAINNVLNRLIEENPAINIIKIGGNKDDLADGIKFVSSAKNVNKNEFNILGGTAFSLCSDELENSVDYLFVDEAGQVSIPNLIAMSNASKNIILIGDQMQLEQPLQAIHPGDSGKSCLEYYLGDKKTIPTNLGFFLPVTRRMNSQLCKIISDNFYESKLSSHESSENRFIILNNSKDNLIKKDRGFLYIETEHEYNNQYSSEEVEIIKNLTKELKKYTLSFDGETRKITEKDIIYVSPYNMQVKKIKEELGEDVNAGSVDLFQGQEAPIVIISLASSNADGRGLEFLLSENRLNVAISRGQALAILIANKNLIRSNAQSIKELKLLNMFSNLIKNT